MILFRKSLSSEDELNAAKQYFTVVENRHECRGLVIPRYSSLPYYNELESDIRDGTLINSYSEHKWIANFEWYDVLRKYTFDTWTTGNIAHAPQDIKYVVKGKTNSKKWRWSTQMFARNRKEAISIGSDLYSDGLIGSQGILYRRYEPLVTYEFGINGLPFTNEYRFFFLKNKLVADGFYWSIAEETDRPTPKAARDLAEEIANIASKYTNFFVLDIAQREDHTWVLVEINCGTMSGLSMINPTVFYKNLKDLVDQQYS